MGGAINLFALYAFMIWTGTNCTFTLGLIQVGFFNYLDSQACDSMYTVQ